MISAGKLKSAIDTSDLTAGDSIAAYLVAAGTQLTATGTSLDVNVTASALPTGAATEATLAAVLAALGGKSEDSAHASGDSGSFILSVRNDNQSTTFTSANGDYAPFATDSKGAVYTKNVNNASNLQQVITVGTSAVALPTTPLSNRTAMFIQMLSSGSLYLGSSTVSNSGANRGLLLGSGGFVSLDVGPGNLVYGIANAAGKDVAVWEFA